MSGHADTIRAVLPSRGHTTVWSTARESEKVHAALDALLAENQRLREELADTETEKIERGTENQRLREALTLILDTVPMHLYPWEKAREALAGDAE